MTPSPRRRIWIQLAALAAITGSSIFAQTPRPPKLAGSLFRHEGHRTSEGQGGDDWFVFGRHGQAARALVVSHRSGSTSVEDLRITSFAVNAAGRLTLQPSTSGSGTRETTFALTDAELVVPALVAEGRGAYTFFDNDGGRYRSYRLAFASWPTASTPGTLRFEAQFRADQPPDKGAATAILGTDGRLLLEAVPAGGTPPRLPTLRLEKDGAIGECFETGGPSSRRFARMTEKELPAVLSDALRTARFEF